MASRFGHKQWKTKQPKQHTQKTNTASEHPNSTPPASEGTFFLGGKRGGDERVADEGPQGDKYRGQLSLNPVSPKE